MFTPGSSIGVTILKAPGSFPDFSVPVSFFDVSNGDIYVSENTNNRVMKYTVSGTGLKDTLTTAEAGTYQVIATTFNGCSVTSNQIVINQTPDLSSLSGVNTVCSGSTISVSDTALGGIWISSNPTIATINNNGLITGLSDGIDTIKYTVIKNGCSNTVTKLVSVDAPPTISLIQGGCGSSLIANISGKSAGSLIWSYNGNAQDTIFPKYYKNAVTVAGGNGFGGAPNQLAYNEGIFIDNSDSLYVADVDNNRVLKFKQSNLNGSIVAGGNGVGNGTSQLNSPMSVFVDAQNNSYVCDGGNARVLKFSKGNTNGVIVAGGHNFGNASNQLSSLLMGLYVDASGNVYVSDAGNNRVQRWMVGDTVGVTIAGGNGAGSLNTQLNFPTGIFVDKDTNLFVADATNNRVQKWNKNATSGITVAGITGIGGPPDSIHLSYVKDVKVDINGTMYITDGFNRVLRWKNGYSYGEVIEGTNYSGGSGSSELNGPFSIAFGSNGDLFVSDQYNNRVQKFADSGIYNTYLPVNPGIYSVKATSFRGCSTTDSTTVIFSGTTKVSFTVNSVSQCLNGNSFTFTNTGTSCGIPSYLWSFGDGTTSTATNPTKTYNTAGRYLVTLKVTIAGVDYFDNQCQYIVVISTPPVTLNNTGNICSGHDTLQLSPIADAAKLVWYNGGVPIDTFYSSLSDTAITIATSNGLNGFVLDDSGNVYVIDVYGSWRILKYAVGTANSTVVAGGNGNGSAANQLVDPWGVTVDKCGNLYVSDYANNRIQKFPAGSTGATNAITIAGGNGQGNAPNQLSMPYGMYIDINKNLYIADAGNNRIIKYAPDSTNGIIVAGGNGNGSAANQLHNPFGVWVDKNGYLYVADAGNNRVQKFDPGSTIASNAVTVAGGNGSGNAANQLSYPNNVFVDADGNLFVSDDNIRIQKFPAGSSSTTNGITIAGGHGHGSASNQLAGPWGIYIDNNGNVYVGDESNHRVQKFIPHINTNFIPTASGDYKAVVTTINGCTTTSNTINLSSSTVTPSFIINSVSQCLNGNSFSYTNTSNVCGTASYLWSFGDGTTASTANAVHSYTNPNSYNVTLKITVSGIDYYSSQTVVVSSAPVASFNILAGTGSGNAYTFISSSTINSGYISSYLWSFGDGTTDNTSNPNHIYATIGTYNVKLVVTSNGGCKDSITKSVVVTLSGGGGTTPVPSFIVNNAQQCFNVNSFIFTNTSVAPIGTTYLWNFGDGSTSTSVNATHSYTSQGNYNVTLIATYNGIDHYYAQTVWVKPMPVSGFSFFANKQSIYEYTFLSTSTIASGNMTYAWNFGDGSTDSVSNPQHTFTSDGRKDITLVVTSDAGCKDSITHYQIFCPTMNNKAFRINAANGCLSTNFWSVQNYYGNSLHYPMSFFWDYGDGTTSTMQFPPWHTYATAGNKTITLKVTLAYPGCSPITDSTAAPFVVHPMPVASFNITGSPTTMCWDSSNHYTFNNTSSISLGDSLLYIWDFGDNNNSSLANPTHSYAATHSLNYNHDYYTIKLFAYSIYSCSDSVTQNITLHPVPVATDFAINGIYGNKDHYLDFRGGSTPAPYSDTYVLNDTTECFAGYNWFGHALNGSGTSPNDYWRVNFDDGTSGVGDVAPGGALEAPYHAYTTPGIHNFSGNWMSNFGCLSNTVYGHITITPNNDTLPHSVIGLHSEITTNVGIDPYGNSYNHYKVFFANLGSTGCRPIVASYFHFSFLSGAPYYNHGDWTGGGYGLLPTTSDSAYFGFDADPSVTYQIRLITINDQGRADTAYATIGATNAGYVPFKADIITNLPHIGIFPNPAIQITNVEASSDKSTNATLIVYNTIGQIVSTKRIAMLANLKQSISINVSTWAEGIYYVLLKDEQGIVIGKSKFIKSIK